MTNLTQHRHRSLRFSSIDEVLAEVERIVAADAEGRLTANGNWTPGEILSHVAAWIEYAYEGYPMKPAPWFVRWLLRWQLKKYLRHGLPRGIRIPGVKEGTYGMEKMETRPAAERLKRAFERLRSREPAKFPSPGFGPLSDDDRIELNVRHAELHLSYLDY